MSLLAADDDIAGSSSTAPQSAVALSPDSSLAPTTNLGGPAAPSERMRSHRGNRPSLPKTKQCPQCPARFTRTAHLNRHLRTHTNERLHRCPACDAEFTRSDLLARHRSSCGSPVVPPPSRRKSCQSCAESKIKCDLQEPCTRCSTRGKDCVYLNDPKASLEKKAASVARKNQRLPAVQEDGSDREPTAEDSPQCSIQTDFELGSTDMHFGIAHSPSNLSLSSTPSRGTLSRAEPADGLDLPNAVNSFFPALDLGLLSLGAETNAGLTADPESQYFDDLLAMFTANNADLSGGAPVKTDVMSDQQAMFPTSQGWLGEGVSTPSYAYDVHMTPFADTSAQTAASIDLGYAVSPPSDTTSPSTVLSSEGHDSPSDIRILRMCAEHVAPATLQHYLYLFHTNFVTHLPLLHMSTWTLKGKPDILIRAIEACGALFAGTSDADEFITDTIESTQDRLLRAMTNVHGDLEQQLYVILAGLLLQAIGLSRDSFENRASSNLYHGMIIMMIQKCGLMTRCSEYVPPTFDDSMTGEDVNTAWRAWAMHETMKRTLHLAYVHDTYHCVYYSLPPSFSQNDVHWRLPADDDLWHASTAEEWLNRLRKAPSHCDVATRLTGFNVQAALQVLGGIHVVPIELPLSTFSHLILIHFLISEIAATHTCSEVGAPKTSAVSLQSALQIWLHSWKHSCESSGLNHAQASQNALRFYWLAQITLLVGAQAPRMYSLKADVRYRVMMRWAAHIRAVVKDNQPASPSLWYDLLVATEAGQDKAPTGTLSKTLFTLLPDI
ncbi:unnamed protein product [Peniophora sp. CBMAI 1063]|nr:unnamed protein product [Peniophora sp. CBMAI 1063]